MIRKVPVMCVCGGGGGLYTYIFHSLHQSSLMLFDSQPFCYFCLDYSNTWTIIFLLFAGLFSSTIQQLEASLRQKFCKEKTGTNYI